MSGDEPLGSSENSSTRSPPVVAIGASNRSVGPFHLTVSHMTVLYIRFVELPKYKRFKRDIQIYAYICLYICLYIHVYIYICSYMAVYLFFIWEDRHVALTARGAVNATGGV